MELTLKRIKELVWGTFGVLVGDDFIVATCERTWENNAPNISCIPEGTYVCKRVTSPKFGNTFEVTGVKDRTEILFHKGNFAQSDSKGCILVGIGFAEINKQWAITDAGLGFGRFLKELEGLNEFKLIVKNV